MGRHENSATWFLKLPQLRKRDFRFSMYLLRGVPQLCLPCLGLFTTLDIGRGCYGVFCLLTQGSTLQNKNNRVKRKKPC